MLCRRNKENASPYDRVVERKARGFDGALISQKAVLALELLLRRWVLALAVLMNDGDGPQ
jgi:hypothetical protein